MWRTKGRAMLPYLTHRSNLNYANLSHP
jgi:hypothetical protein